MQPKTKSIPLSDDPALADLFAFVMTRTPPVIPVTATDPAKKTDPVK